MNQARYKQFCPIAMSAEFLCTRWTMLLVRELLAGSTRFNDIRRGVPRMSPTLLSQRLRELESAGIVERKELASEKGVYEYHLTEAGKDLHQVVNAMGFWGNKWIDTSRLLDNLDAGFLMWTIRRSFNPSPLPKKRSVIQFSFPELPPSKRRWWMVVEPNGEVDLCAIDPGFEVDLYVETDMKTMTSIWMGVTTVSKQAAKIVLTGDKEIASTMQIWLGQSPFVVDNNRAVA